MHAAPFEGRLAAQQPVLLSVKLSSWVPLLCCISTAICLVVMLRILLLDVVCHVLLCQYWLHYGVRCDISKYMLSVALVLRSVCMLVLGSLWHYYVMVQLNILQNRSFQMAFVHAGIVEPLCNSSYHSSQLSTGSETSMKGCGLHCMDAKLQRCALIVQGGCVAVIRAAVAVSAACV